MSEITPLPPVPSVAIVLFFVGYVSLIGVVLVLFNASNVEKRRSMLGKILIFSMLCFFIGEIMYGVSSTINEETTD